MGNREQSSSLGLGPVSLGNHPENGTCPLCSFGGGTYSDKLRSDPRRHLGMGKQHIAHITPLLPALSPCRPFSSGIAGLQPPPRSSTARACCLSPTTLVSVPQPQSTRATSQGSSAVSWLICCCRDPFWGGGMCGHCITALCCCSLLAG